MADVHEYAEQLRQYATHFAPRDWNYTRNHDIRVLRMISTWDRLKDVAGYTVRSLSKKSQMAEMFNVPRWRMVVAHWNYHNNLPDGVLDGGSVITIWEETGEYLQYVQPSVGALLADLMDAHPDLPEVQAIAAEMKRINDDYGQRVNAETEPA